MTLLMNSRLSFLALPLLLVGCGGSDSGFDDNSRTAVVDIPNAPQYCFIDESYQSGPVLCFPDVVADNGEHVYPLSIEGFNYEFGTSYQLRVRIYDIESPDADARSVGYELVDVVNKSTAPVGSVYSYNNVQLMNLPFAKPKENLYTFGFLEFQCGEGVDCDYLVQNGESGGAINIEFTLTSDNTPVTLTDWN